MNIHTAQTPEAKLTKKRETDFAIRAAVVDELIGFGIPRGDIRHEIPMSTASAGGRIDVLVLRDEFLAGIEIKGPKDTLAKLGRQIDRYEACLDRVAIVLDWKWRYSTTNDHRWRWNCSYWHGELGWVNGYDNQPYPTHPKLLTPRFSGKTVSLASTVKMAGLLWRNEIVSIMADLTGPAIDTRYRCLTWIDENACRRDVRPLVIQELRGRPLNKWEEAFWAEYDQAERMNDA